jgi:hypothetical protein
LGNGLYEILRVYVFMLASLQPCRRFSAQPPEGRPGGQSKRDGRERMSGEPHGFSKIAQTNGMKANNIFFTLTDFIFSLDTHR